MRKFSAFLLTLLLTFTVLQAQNQSSFKIENTNDYLYILTLENGFTVFLREDPASALIHSQFTCRAGFTRQNKFNAGFFPLYTRLFTTPAKKNSKILKKIPVESECKSDSSTYTSDFSPMYLTDYLEALNLCLTANNFSDENIRSEYRAMKAEVTDYAESPAGFINSAIDSRVFSQEPWKVDSGIYPALFSSYTTQEVRTILSEIGRKYYNPSNCALFISGNISKDEVCKLCTKIFSSWNRGTVSGTSSLSKPSAEKKSDTEKKYVLTSKDFSPEISQLVIQYESLSMSEADILSAAWNNFDSPLKANVLKEGLTAVRSGEYINSSSAQKSISSRLIVQTLMEAPYSFIQSDDVEKKSPSDQADRFVELLRESSLLSRKQFVSAQNEIYSKYKVQNGSPAESMNNLSSYWALSEIGSTEDFYQNYQNLAHQIQNQNEKIISQKISSEQPYVFILVNDSVYKKYKDSFTSSGYQLINEKNASWYSTELDLLKQKNQQTSENEASDENEIVLTNFAESFYKNNINSIKSFKLKNGIPVTIKENPESQSACISICIAGGELSSPDSERYLRTVLINAFTRNIQDELTLLKRTNIFEGKTQLKAWTEETHSYITINCAKNDIQYVLQAAFNAVIYGEVSPVTVDNLVKEQAYQWRTKNAYLSQQLKNSAMYYLYRDTSFAKFYNQNVQILKKTSYNSINLSYTQLLDAKLYSIVIAGDIEFENAENYFEDNFAVMKNQPGEQETPLIPEPRFKIKNKNVQLLHTFTTDLPAESAPKESPILVPTKEFFDPAQYYFTVPSDNSDKEIFNALLFEFENLMQDELGENIRISSYPCNSIIHAAVLQADQLPRTSLYLSAYKKVREYLLDDLVAREPEITEEENKITEEVKNSEQEVTPVDMTSEIQLQKNQKQTEADKKISVEENTISVESSSETKTESKVESENTNAEEKIIEEKTVEKKEPVRKAESLKDIKALWCLKNLSATKDNEGTAALIQKGLLQNKSSLYLENYVYINNASPEKYYEILEKYFPAEPPFKVLSYDSKK